MKLLNISLSLFARVFAALLGLSTQVILAKFIAADIFGQYIVIITFFNLFFILSKFGFDTLIIREVAKAQGDVNKSNTYVTSLLIISYVFVALAGLTILTTFFVTKYTGIIDIYFPVSPLKYAICVALFFMPLLSVNLSIFRGEGSVLTADIIELLIRPCVFLFFIIVILYKLTPNVDYLIFALLLSYLFGYVITLLTPKKGKYLNLKNYHDLSRNSLRNIFKQSSYICVATLFSFIYFQLDTLIVSHYQGNKDAGIYGMVSSLTKAITLIPMILNSYAQPKFAFLKKNNSHKYLQNHLKYIMQISLIFSIVTWLFFVFFGKNILAYISSEYTSGYLVLVVMCFAHILNSIVIILTGYFNMTGLEASLTKIYMSGALITTVLNFYLIPTVGMLGGAIALNIGLLFCLCILLFKLYIVYK